MKDKHGNPGKWQATLRSPVGKHMAQADTRLEAMRQVFDEALYAVEYIAAAEADGRAMMAGEDLR